MFFLRFVHNLIYLLVFIQTMEWTNFCLWKKFFLVRLAKDTLMDCQAQGYLIYPTHSLSLAFTANVAKYCLSFHIDICFIIQAIHDQMKSHISSSKKLTNGRIELKTLPFLISLHRMSELYEFVFSTRRVLRSFFTDSFEESRGASVQ